MLFRSRLVRILNLAYRASVDERERVCRRLRRTLYSVPATYAPCIFDPEVLAGEGYYSMYDGIPPELEAPEIGGIEYGPRPTVSSAAMISGGRRRVHSLPPFGSVLPIFERRIPIPANLEAFEEARYRDWSPRRQFP